MPLWAFGEAPFRKQHLGNGLFFRFSSFGRGLVSWLVGWLVVCVWVRVRVRVRGRVRCGVAWRGVCVVVVVVLTMV